MYFESHSVNSSNVFLAYATSQQSPAVERVYTYSQLYRIRRDLGQARNARMTDGNTGIILVTVFGPTNPRISAVAETHVTGPPLQVVGSNCATVV